MKLNKVPVIIVILFYLLIVLPVILIQFFHLRKAVLDGLNRDLYLAARDMGQILDDDFYEMWNKDNPLPPGVYERIKEELNSYADHFEIEYAYSMVKEGDTVYFVVSNETEEDIHRGTPSLFYNPYPDPPADVLKAFETDEPFLSSSYTNIWDSYYSFFLPRKTSSGLTYVLAADVKLDFKRSKLNNSLVLLAVMVFVMLASLLPIYLFWLYHSRKQAESLRAQLFTDRLTGLPNRARFMEDYAGSGERPLSAVMLDIDSFSDVNNLFGGYVGDMALEYAREVIQDCVKGAYPLYKFPADEYVLVLEGVSRQEAIGLTEHIISSFRRRSFITEGQGLCLSMRGGISLDSSSRKALLSSMNIAKNLAKYEYSGYVVYEDSMDREESYSKNFFWLNSLKEALEEDRIVPFYQPIQDNVSGEISRYEALVRMLDREGRPIPPSDFLSVAMRSKLYRELTEVMVRKSLSDFAHRPGLLSLNFSTRDLLDEGTMDYLYSQVEEKNMKGRVILELLESESLFDIPDLSERLEKCRDRGVLIAIDDFGSGYSNFSYLSKIPLHLLKIDGSLIRGLLADSFSEAVVTAIAAFSRDLKIPLVAEYVEDEVTRQKLSAMGIAYSQGYHIGRPVPAEELSRPKVSH